MKRYSALLAGFFIGFLSVSFMAAKSGCRLEGSWLGFGADGSRWLATYHGESANAGTNDLEFFYEPTLGGLFPSAVSISSGRGVWVRTGGNTFAYTLITFGLDAGGNVAWIIKNSGNKTLTDNCDLMTIEGTLEVFLPEVDPFEGEPLFCGPGGGSEEVRMRVDPPCSP